MPATTRHTKSRHKLIAGVDEVGRGPLAGSVVAAAVILDPRYPIAGLADSKVLTAAKREELDSLIRDRAIAWAIGEASVAEIDEINILHASMLAMRRAVEALSIVPDKVLVDGNRRPDIAHDCEAIVKGDKLFSEISAASIIAKVARDQQMLELHQQHPEFGFDRHKGYPTKAHREALARHGVLPVHRQSFAPVKAVLTSK
ncbi:MAG: ribonuclease HII [Gammaproteobacteria bacterium]|nr:ribonuclease HII [Gammaproteobacteria bacterium]